MKQFICASALCLASIFTATGQDYLVQVGAFNQGVPLSYFAGLKGVYEERDHNDIYRYFIGGFKKQAEAETTAAEAKKAGFRARVIDLEEIRQQCTGSCRPQTLRWIFFDYDQADLRADSKAQLKRLADVLKNNPGWRAELSAHTDSHGSNEYNDGLSKRRVEAARSHLVSLGAEAKRLTETTHGEAQPIAKNEVGASDSPTGRQFNRRVELIILDEKGREMNDVVDEPVVPGSLKN